MCSIITVLFWSSCLKVILKVSLKKIYSILSGHCLQSYFLGLVSGFYNYLFFYLFILFLVALDLHC